MLRDADVAGMKVTAWGQWILATRGSLLTWIGGYFEPNNTFGQTPGRLRLEELFGNDLDPKQCATRDSQSKRDCDW